MRPNQFESLECRAAVEHYEVASTAARKHPSASSEMPKPTPVPTLVKSKSESSASNSNSPKLRLAQNNTVSVRAKRCLKTSAPTAVLSHHPQVLGGGLFHLKGSSTLHGTKNVCESMRFPAPCAVDLSRNFFHTCYDPRPSKSEHLNVSNLRKC